MAILPSLRDSGRRRTAVTPEAGEKADEPLASLRVEQPTFVPSPGSPMDFEATLEFYLRKLQSFNTSIEKILVDPFQMHRSITTLQQSGLPIEPFPQTQPNLTLATETLYSALNNQRIRLYDAPDLRQHVLNAASIETSRGFRLTKEKQSLKIDGAAALSLRVLRPAQTGRPLSPEDIRNYKEPEIDTKFDPFEFYR